MNSEIVVALVFAVVFFGAMGWLVVHSRLQETKGNKLTNDKRSDGDTGKRAA